MKNPLRKRILREIKDDIGKYLVIFLLLTFTIGLISGFIVADDSLMAAYNESFEKYNVEDGHFVTENKLNKAQIKSVEQMEIDLYDLSYIEESITNGSTLRIYAQRDTVDTVCLICGAFPNKVGEIAIDRMYANNNQIEVGDKLYSDSHTWTVTGLVALPDYSSLFANNSDTMFDALLFGVAIVSQQEFVTYATSNLNYCYAWKYEDGFPANEVEENKIASNLMDRLLTEISLKEYVPRYQNQAINFTGEDLGSDRGSMILLLYMMIAIMAFVFGITISNTITKEANVIGTLRASGYTRWELIRHYIEPPLLITVISAIIGNIFGYTVLCNEMADLYYNSYSLTTYEKLLNGNAFFLTTVIPFLMMMGINLFILWRKMAVSPLKFLRRDLSRGKSHRAFPLHCHIPFFLRFHLRVIFQNLSNYVMLFVGICFASLLLLFGLGFPDLLNTYEENIQTNLLCNYQYILQVPLNAMNDSRKLESMLNMLSFTSEVETENKDAEKFTAYTLKTMGDYEVIAGELCASEEISMYGVEPDSKYIPIVCSENEVYISQTMADKYLYHIGDTFQLKEAYDSDVYTFQVAGIYDYSGGLTVFMDKDAMNAMLDLGKSYFSGYLSDSEITDIKENYIASVIDLTALTKISRQLTHSMGSMMSFVVVFAVAVFMILIYLLSKMIIEKNSQSISMAKILGYSDGEIFRLYMMPTSIMVVFFLLISMPLVYDGLLVLMRYMMMLEMTGWMPIKIHDYLFAEIFAIGFVTYLMVVGLEYLKITRIPMDEALKNVE